MVEPVVASSWAPGDRWPWASDARHRIPPTCRRIRLQHRGRGLRFPAGGGGGRRFHADRKRRRAMTRVEPKPHRDLCRRPPSPTKLQIRLGASPNAPPPFIRLVTPEWGTDDYPDAGRRTRWDRRYPYAFFILPGVPSADAATLSRSSSLRSSRWGARTGRTGIPGPGGREAAGLACRSMLLARSARAPGPGAAELFDWIASGLLLFATAPRPEALAGNLADPGPARPPPSRSRWPGPSRQGWTGPATVPSAIMCVESRSRRRGSEWSIPPAAGDAFSAGYLARFGAHRARTPSTPRNAVHRPSAGAGPSDERGRPPAADTKPIRPVGAPDTTG